MQKIRTMPELFCLLLLSKRITISNREPPRYRIETMKSIKERNETFIRREMDSKIELASLGLYYIETFFIFPTASLVGSFIPKLNILQEVAKSNPAFKLRHLASSSIKLQVINETPRKCYCTYFLEYSFSMLPTFPRSVLNC